MRILLENGADPGAEDVNGFTPLHYAAMHSHFSLAALLLSGGADPNAHGCGFTVLHNAAGSGKKEYVELLLSRGADAGIRNRGGKTALEIAEARGYSDIAALLRPYL